MLKSLSVLYLQTGRLSGCQIGDGFNGYRLKFGYITANVLFIFNKF